VRVQAAHDREHGWSISFTLCRGLHTVPTFRVKAPENFRPNHVMLAKHHTTLPRCDCIGMLRSLYKDMQKTNDPHSYRSAWTITLPNGQHLSKGCYPRRTGLYPSNPDPPLLLSEKVHWYDHTTNYSAKVQAMWHCGCACFLGWFSRFRLNQVFLHYPTHWSLHIEHFLLKELYILPKLSN
jgi:hypothetical protein